MYKVAVVGATGAVGREMISILEQRDFPLSEIKALASDRSLGRTLEFKGEDIPVDVLDKNSLDDIDVALFSAGDDVSKEFAPHAARNGTLIIDNSPAFRQDKDVPLTIPEVNPESIDECPRKIIANPNCVVIQIAVATHPIHKAANINRLVVSTYQAASGAGNKAIDELSKQTVALFSGEESPLEVFPKTLAFNCLPSIGTIQASGFTSEEEKILEEIPKLFTDDKIKIAATAVRVPVFCGHGATIAMELEGDLTVKQTEDLLANSSGIELRDNLLAPRDAAGEDLVYVSRIRKDNSVKNGLLMWVVSDNLRKGAALNAIQIAELAIKRELI